MSIISLSGTLLGAVQHSGFIPWDDDVDIEIPIREYRRFLEIAQKGLGNYCFAQTSVTDPNFSFAYTRIRKNNITFLFVYRKSYQTHHGVWIVIFPVAPVNPGISLPLKRKWLSLIDFIQIQNRIDSHREEFEEKLGPAKLFAIDAFSKPPMKTRVRILNAMLNLVFNAAPDTCTHMANIWGNITTVFPKEVYQGEAQQVEVV